MSYCDLANTFTAWNANGKTGFFWAGTASIIFTWAFFRLPEMKGRTYEELDILFANRVPARKFASTHVDAYAAASPEIHYDSHREPVTPAVTKQTNPVKEVHEVEAKQ